jgi:quinol monooxygenase YgiN
MTVLVNVIAATWTALEGKEDVVADALSRLAVEARLEEGCLVYIAHRSSKRPREFFIYEQYADKEAFDAQVNSAHFQKYGRDTAIPHLDTRSRSLNELPA